MFIAVVVAVVVVVNILDDVDYIVAAVALAAVAPAVPAGTFAVARAATALLRLAPVSSLMMTATIIICKYIVHSYKTTNDHHDDVEHLDGDYQDESGRQQLELDHRDTESREIYGKMR